MKTWPRPWRDSTANGNWRVNAGLQKNWSESLREFFISCTKRRYCMCRKNPPPIANLAQHAVDHLHITKTLTAKTGPDTIVSRTRQCL